MLNSARSLRGLLLLSGLILLVHTLVPHVHGPHFLASGQTILAETPASPSWLDVLAGLVDTDMGEEHLEHFSPEKNVDYTLAAPAFVPGQAVAPYAELFFCALETSGGRTGFSRSPVPQIEEVYLRRIAPRGPPPVA